MKNLAIGSAVCLVVLAPMLAIAEIPVEGVRAEQENRWTDAIAIYHKALAANPRQADLWFRLADIHASRSDQQSLLRGMEDAAQALPEDPRIFYRLSQVYALGNDPRKALSACLRAVELDPANRDYLLACASHANWSGDFAVAESSYRRLLEYSADDPDALLGLARSRSWSGSLDQAAKDYATYLKLRPDDREAWIEYVKVETWKGDYHKALTLLDGYSQKFGETPGYLKEKARLLAWAGRPARASMINDPLLAGQPGDYEINYTNTVILHRSRRPGAAIDSLGRLGEMRPTSKETLDVGRVVRTPVRHSVALELDYYNDSDTIRAQGATLSGVFNFSPDTALTAGARRAHQTAQVGSGLEPVFGDEDITHDSQWIGLKHRFNPVLALQGEVGKGTIEDVGDFDVIRLYGHLNPNDNTAIRLAYEEDVFAISPRSVSLGITRATTQVDLHWEPDLRHVVDAIVRHDDLSDGNRRDQLVIGPRRAVARKEKFNLDIGVSGEWLRYDQDLNNGYYDPDNYRRFAVTAFGYRKLSDDDGISVSASVGWHRDETMDGYHFGEDLVAEGFFGIYRDWFLRVKLGYSDRHEGAGSYDGFLGSASITRRLD